MNVLQKKFDDISTINYFNLIIQFITGPPVIKMFKPVFSKKNPKHKYEKSHEYHIKSKGPIFVDVTLVVMSFEHVIL